MQQQLVEHLLRRYLYAKFLQGWIGDVSRKEHKKLDSEKHQLYGRMSEEVKLAVEWETQRQRYKHLLPGGVAVGCEWSWLLCFNLLRHIRCVLIYI